MKIHMLHSRRGSEDGYDVKLYEGGQSYEVSDLLAGVLIKMGAAYADGGSPERRGMFHGLRRGE